MKKQVSVLAILALIAFLCIQSCFSMDDNLMSPSETSTTVLLVDTGFTTIPQAMLDSLGSSWFSGINEAFTIRWTPVQDAEWYEVRLSRIPITPETWETAVLAAVIQAPADSADVFVQPEVYQNTCIGCGQCVAVCPHQAIQLVDGKSVIDISKCTSCGECVRVCPASAIRDSRFGQAYYIGLRPFYGEGEPADEIVVSETAYKLVYFIDPLMCPGCPGDIPGGGFCSGCTVLEDSMEQAGVMLDAGPGCPVSALALVPNDAVYIDYDKCINCGQCLIECWNIGQVRNPALPGLWAPRRKVVPADWVPPVVPDGAEYWN
jgi:ferredoxin